MCVQVWLRFVQSSQRLGVEKKKTKEEEITAVKYKPFGIAMPCGPHGLSVSGTGCVSRNEVASRVYCDVRTSLVTVQRFH